MFLPHRLLEMRASQGTWEGIILSWSVSLLRNMKNAERKIYWILYWKILNFIPVYNMWLLKKKLCTCLKSLQGCTTLSDTMVKATPARQLCLWDSPGKNTGVGCHVLLQGGSTWPRDQNRLLHILHCRLILYQWATTKTPPKKDEIC